MAIKIERTYIMSRQQSILESIEKLSLKNGDIVLFKVTQITSNEQLIALWRQLRAIAKNLKQKLNIDVQFILLNNQWSKMTEVNIMDAKGAIFQLQRLRKQLGSMIDSLNSRLKFQAEDAIEEAVLNNKKQIQQKKTKKKNIYNI